MAERPQPGQKRGRSQLDIGAILGAFGVGADSGELDASSFEDVPVEGGYDNTVPSNTKPTHSLKAGAKPFKEAGWFARGVGIKDPGGDMNQSIALQGITDPMDVLKALNLQQALAPGNLQAQLAQAQGLAALEQAVKNKGLEDQGNAALTQIGDSYDNYFKTGEEPIDYLPQSIKTPRDAGNYLTNLIANTGAVKTGAENLNLLERTMGARPHQRTIGGNVAGAESANTGVERDVADSDAGKRLRTQGILAKLAMPLAELDKANTYTAQPNTTAFTVGNTNVPGSVDRKITGSSPFDIEHMSYVTDKGRVIADQGQLQPGEKIVMPIPGKSSKGYTAAMFEEGMPNPGFGVGGNGPVNLGGQFFAPKPKSPAKVTPLPSYPQPDPVSSFRVGNEIKQQQVVSPVDALADRARAAINSGTITGRDWEKLQQIWSIIKAGRNIDTNNPLQPERRSSNNTQGITEGESKKQKSTTATSDLEELLRKLKY